ncbi:MAG: alpha/beta fold hydrolase [Luteimonas sp.]
MRLPTAALLLSAFAGLSPLAHAASDARMPCPDAMPAALLADSTCTVVRLPLRHEAPDAAGIEVFVRRVPAPDPTRRRGEVWLIAGGPGEPGVALHPMLATFREAFPDHDLVIPDHRGTGRSTRLCPAQESPDSAGGVSLAGTEWGPCIGALHADTARTTAFTITQAAQDLSALIARQRQPGDVHVYAVSYGTQLALRMLQVAPQPLDGLVLDGLVPAELDMQWDISHRTALVDAVGREVLGPDGSAAYARVLARNDPDAAWRAHVPGGDLRRVLGTLLNFPTLRDRLPAIVDALARDDAAPLRTALEDLGGIVSVLTADPMAPPSLPLVMLVSTSENNNRPALDRATVDAEARDALFTSAIPGFLVDPPLPLYERDAHYGQTPTALPRTLVIHGTLDPNTAYAGALSHVEALSKAGPVQMTTVERGAHLLAFVAPSCFAASVRAFLEAGAVPPHCSEPPTAQ